MILSRPLRHVPEPFKKIFLTEQNPSESGSILNVGTNMVSFFNVYLMTIWLLGCQNFLTKYGVRLPNYIASESSGAADLFPNNFWKKIWGLFC